MALVGVMLVLATVDQQGREFFRDEDFDLTSRSMIYARALTPLPEGEPWWSALVDRAHDVAYQSVFYRHGAFPFILGGILYKALDALGIAFDYATFQIPSGILAAATVGFLFALLRRAKIDRRVAVLGCALFALSPLFLGLARGVATFMWVGIAFQHVFALWALQGLDRQTPSRWPVVVASAVLALGDSIYYLFVVAVVATFALRDVEKPRELSGLSRAGMTAALRPLTHWLVWLPLALLTALNLWAYARYSILGDAVPAPLFAAAHKRAEFLPSLLSLDRLGQAAVVLLGEGGIVLVMLAIVVVVLVKARPRGFLFAFSIIGGAGYAILHYILTPVVWGKIHTHQVYLLLPAVLFVAHAFDGLAKRAPGTAWSTLIVMGMGVAGTAASAATHLWHAPLAATRDWLTETTFGGERTAYGTKAAGFIVREHLRWALMQGQHDFDVHIYEPSIDRRNVDRGVHGFRLFHGPFRHYAGLLDGGAFFMHATGRRLRARTFIHDCEAAECRDADVSDLPACAASFCVAVIGRGRLTAPLFAYGIKRAGSSLAVVFLPNSNFAARAAGEHAEGDLAVAFHRTYRSLADYFPDPYVFGRGRPGSRGP